MARARYTSEGILNRRAARRILRPYAGLLADVVFDAWETWNVLGTAAPGVRMRLGRAARAMNVSDFIKDEIVRRFDNRVKGCDVVWEYGRPVLTFAGGDLKIRLGKIDLIKIPSPRNDRQFRIWSQADATSDDEPPLDEMPSGTWAKCGYVLDRSETCVAGIHVVCDMNGSPKWKLDFPIPARKPSTDDVKRLVSHDVPSSKITSAVQPSESQQKSASSE